MLAILMFIVASLALDPIRIQINITEPQFSESLHSYYQTIDEFCFISVFDFYFIIIIFSIAGILFFLACFIGRNNKSENFKQNTVKMVKMFKIKAFILTSLFVASILTLALVSQSNSDTIVITICIASNLFSTTCFSILFFPLFPLKHQINSMIN